MHTEINQRLENWGASLAGLRPAGGFLRKADDFQHTCGCFQSLQGTLCFPCAGCASYLNYKISCTYPNKRSIIKNKFIF